MTPPSTQFAERVWEQTLPALRRRRLARRTVLTGTGALLLGLLTLPLLPILDHPARYQWVAAEPSPGGPITSNSVPSSLAILVVDQSGARFRELRPDEITDEGLDFELTLEPLITYPVAEFY